MCAKSFVMQIMNKQEKTSWNEIKILFTIWLRKLQMDLNVTIINFETLITMI